MNKFLEHAFQLEDKRRGYTVYRHGQPAYQVTRQWEPWQSIALGLLIGSAIVVLGYILLGV